VALLVVRGGAVGRFVANHLLRSVRILWGIRGITRKSRPRFGRLLTQGRCATRLRYAPTSNARFYFIPFGHALRPQSASIGSRIDRERTGHRRRIRGPGVSILLGQLGKNAVKWMRFRGGGVHPV